jgi:hypothetical protein
LADNGEKRTYPRIRVRWPVSVLTDPGIIEAETRNITVNGIFIRSKDQLRLNRVFALRINPPNRQPLDVSGKIVWSDHYAVDSRNISYGMGICFVEISDRDRHFLEDLILSHPDSKT